MLIIRLGILCMIVSELQEFDDLVGLYAKMFSRARASKERVQSDQSDLDRCDSADSS